MKIGTFCAASLLFSGSLFCSVDWLIESQNCMRAAKQLFLTTLRDKNTTIVDYRKATEMASSILAHEAIEQIAQQSFQIQTPLAPIAGTALNQPIVLLPVMRSGITMLHTFLRHFEDARVGFVGLARDEKTAQAHWYYEKLPHLNGNEKIIILEPMLATGGTLLNVLDSLIARGVRQDNVLIASIICAPEGIEALHNAFPNVTIITLVVDSHLNRTKFIVPGLGDFGDRYYGTENSN